MVTIFKSLVSKFFTQFAWAYLHVLANKIGIEVENIIARVNDLEADRTLVGRQKLDKISGEIGLMAAARGKTVALAMVDEAVLVALNIVRGNK